MMVMVVVVWRVMLKGRQLYIMQVSIIYLYLVLRCDAMRQLLVLFLICAVDVMVTHGQCAGMAGDLIPLRELLTGSSLSVWCTAEEEIAPVLKHLGQRWASSRRADRSARQGRQERESVLTGQRHFCPMPSYSLLMTLHTYYLSALAVRRETLAANASLSQSQSLPKVPIPFLLLSGTVISFNELYFYVDILLAGVTSITGAAPRIQLQYIHFPVRDASREDGGESVLACLLQTCQALHISTCNIPDTQYLFARVLLLCAGGQSPGTEASQVVQIEQQTAGKKNGSHHSSVGSDLATDDTPLISTGHSSMPQHALVEGGEGTAGPVPRHALCPHLTDLLIGYIDLSFSPPSSLPSSSTSTSTSSSVVKLLAALLVSAEEGFPESGRKAPRLHIELRRCLSRGVLWPRDSDPPSALGLQRGGDENSRFHRDVRLECDGLLRGRRGRGTNDDSSHCSSSSTEEQVEQHLRCLSVR
jgi:hypothetical protein